MPKLRAVPLVNPKKKKTPAKRRLRRNPAFGKKKASHQAFKRKTPAVRKAFGKKKERLHVIVGRAASKVYYFTGSRFDTNRNHAAFFRDKAIATQTLKSLRGRAPDAIKTVTLAFA